MMCKATMAALICVLATTGVLAAEPQQPVNGEQRTVDSEKQAEGSQDKVTSSSSPSAPASATSPQSPAVRSPVASTRSTDRLDLDTTVVTGNRELPKVLYIVPWKKADIGDLPAQPFNTLLDEALTPVDRDVFRREVTYYGAVSGAANTADAPPASPATGPEK